jgi:hypothetical protein
VKICQRKPPLQVVESQRGACVLNTPWARASQPGEGEGGSGKAVSAAVTVSGVSYCLVRGEVCTTGGIRKCEICVHTSSHPPKTLIIIPLRLRLIKRHEIPIIARLVQQRLRNLIIISCIARIIPIIDHCAEPTHMHHPPSEPVRSNIKWEGERT